MKKKYDLNLNSTINEAIKQLNYNSKSLLCIKDDKFDKILGVITEGDIRRKLIMGVSKNETLKSHINKRYNFIFEKELISKKFINSKINFNASNKKPYLIPILDKDYNHKYTLNSKEVIGIIEGNKITKNKLSSIIIIGGAGYIGSILSKKLLVKNYKVIVIDKLIYGSGPVENLKKDKNFKLIKKDISNISTQIKHLLDADAVVYLSELVGDPACKIKPIEALKTNYLSLVSVATICKFLNIKRFIYTSSCSVYGAQKKNLLNEKSSIKPLSHYARIKILSEKALAEITDDNFKPTSLRLGTVFGRSLRNRFDLVVNTFCRAAKYDKKIVIHGNGKQIRPNIHVADVAEGIISVLEAPIKKVGGETFNLSCDKNNKSILNLAKKVKNKFSDVEILKDDKLSDKRDYQVTSKKIFKKIGFKANKTIDYAVDEFLDLFEKKSKNKFYSKVFSNYETIKK